MSVETFLKIRFHIQMHWIYFKTPQSCLSFSWNHFVGFWKTVVDRREIVPKICLFWQKLTQTILLLQLRKSLNNPEQTGFVFQMEVYCRTQSTDVSSAMLVKSPLGQLFVSPHVPHDGLQYSKNSRRDFPSGFAKVQDSLIKKHDSFTSVKIRDDRRRLFLLTVYCTSSELLCSWVLSKKRLKKWTKKHKKKWDWYFVIVIS